MRTASFSPDGTVVVTAGGSGVRAWDVKTGKEQGRFGHDFADMASFSSDGRFLVTASDREARVWDAGTGSEMLREPIVHANLMAASFSPDGSLVITASGHPDRNGYSSPPGDNTVRFWDARTGESRFVKHLEHDYETMMVAFGPGRKFVVSNSAGREGGGRYRTLRQDATARLWDVEARKPRFALKHEGWVRKASFIADGTLLVTWGDEKVARVWDMKSGEPKYTLDHRAELSAVAVSPDGRTVLTASGDGTVRLWNSDTGMERFMFRGGCDVRDAWFIAGGRLAVTWSRGGFQGQCDPKVTLWDVVTGEERATVGLEHAEAVGFSTNGKLMFSVEGRGHRPEMQQLRAESLVRVWDLDTGEERFAEPFLSNERVTTATFSLDGRLLVTASGNSALIWAVAGELLQSAIAAATTVCLKPEFRWQNLGESATEARRKYEACERKHGRER